MAQPNPVTRASPGPVRSALPWKRSPPAAQSANDRLRLGRILVSQGCISDADLEQALERQNASGRALGEELVAAGRLTEEALRLGLETQRRLVTGALVAALVTVGPGALVPAHAAQSVSRTVQFVIKVPPMVRVKMRNQPASLEVTARDVERGYVERAGASLLEVTSNTPWQIHFRPSGEVIRTARVSGLAGEVLVGPEGGSRSNLLAARQMSAFELSYRFELAPGAQPGTYPWPLVMSANAV
jgi:hypothetical protein